MNVSIFKTPMMYVSWGLNSGGTTWSGAAGLRDYCLAHGFKSVALDFGAVTSRADVQLLQAAGIEVIIWNVAGGDIMNYINALQPTGVHIQVEGPDQLSGALAAFQAMKDAGWQGKKAIVTTYWGMYDPANPTSGEQWRALAALGCKEAWVECYYGDMPWVGGNLDTMLWQGTVYGIPATALFPLCSTYRGELPANYTGLESRAPHFGCYLAEPMTEAQWKAWGEVRPNVAQVYFWQVISQPTGKVLHEERAITYSPGDDGLTRTLKWLEAHKTSIRATNDIEVKRVLHSEV